ncbi:MAG: Unknown protein [uncultured Sulfurovum sp.]|uniref:Secretion system C-terminal sorting domain-containing protein n=1 Tax=uncultured Sulfurovum sp. TaxID=269237 RepID=A0A6S6U0I1_9BACT|nr:MAG: Unknown protein [uncultured Sulfurovum sp.]
MKIVNKLTVIALLAVTSFVNAGSYLSFFQPYVTPLTMGEEGVLRVGFSERNEIDVDESENIQLVMSLSQVKVKNNDLSLLSGDLLTYFEVIQDENELLFVQNKTIPGDARLLVSMPIEPLTAGEYGGFIINMLAGDITGGDAEVSAYRLIAEGNTSVQTIEKGTTEDGTWGETQVYEFTLTKKQRVKFISRSNKRHRLAIKDSDGNIVKQSGKAKKVTRLQKKLAKGVYTIEVASSKQGSFTLQYK